MIRSNKTSTGVGSEPAGKALAVVGGMTWREREAYGTSHTALR
jgi:hypothetical protein